MLSLSLNLPKKLRLQVSLTKRRGLRSDKPLLPSFSEIQNTKSGNKVSRFFRHIFEHKNVRRILGTNLALMVFASSLFPVNVFNEVEAEQTIISEDVVPLKTERVIQYPVEKVIINQGFRLFHPGIDFDGVTGDPVKPIKAGRIEAISRSRYAYGNAILVDHGGGIDSLYAHLSKIYVIEGQEVTPYTTIGAVGSTGHSSGDHLHLEVRDEGRPINPLSILPR